MEAIYCKDCAQGAFLIGTLEATCPTNYLAHSEHLINLLKGELGWNLLQGQIGFTTLIPQMPGRKLGPI